MTYNNYNHDDYVAKHKSPNKAEFTVGDFVYTNATTKASLKTVKALGIIGEDMKIRLVGNSHWAYNYNSYTASIEDSTRLWQPKIGDICWLRDDEHPGNWTVGRLIDILATRDCPYVTDLDCFDYCEPFIGQLPSTFDE